MKKTILKLFILGCLCMGLFVIASDVNFIKASSNSEDCSVDCGTVILYCNNPETQNCTKTSTSLKCAGEAWKFCHNYTPPRECVSDAGCFFTEYCDGGLCRHR